MPAPTPLIPPVQCPASSQKHSGHWISGALESPQLPVLALKHGGVGRGSLSIIKSKGFLKVNFHVMFMISDY